MKRFNIWQKVLIGVLTVVFIITAIFGALKSNKLKQLDTDVFNVFSSIRYTLFDRPIRLTDNWIKDYVSLDEVREENDRLRENVGSISQYQAEINELKRQNLEFQELLDFKTSNKNYDLLAADVTFRDFERWNNTIKINVGSNQGVKPNDAVIVVSGLVGRVESVEDDSAIVRLIISNDKVSKVAIKIELDDKKTVEGIIDSYNADLGVYKLSLLDKNDKIKKGNRVVTSGAVGTIPGGLVVGEIVSLEQSVNELADDIYVKPSANFNNFESVFVVRGTVK